MPRKPFDPDQILEAIARGERAPACGDAAEMRIGRDGTWRYGGSPIGRPALVRLFASVLRRAEDGRYWLVTPVEQIPVEVEDAPFVAVEVRAEGEGREGRRLSFRTNLDEWVELDGDHPLRLERRPPDGAEVPYLRVRDALEARVERAVFYHLAELAEPDSDGSSLGVWSGGRFHPLGEAA